MTENRLDKGPETLRDIRCPCGALLSRAARGEWRVAETAPSASVSLLQNKCRRCSRILYLSPLSTTTRPAPLGTEPMPRGGVGEQLANR